MAIQITSLNHQHERELFDCGVSTLNTWLRQTARQHHDKRLSQTAVLTESERPNRILAYYALNIRGLVPTETLPRPMERSLPLSAPGLAIGRLAVDLSVRKHGYGEAMLVHAMSSAKAAADIVGGTFLFVDAIDDHAAEFYRKYGFVALPDKPLTLVMPISAIP